MCLSHHMACLGGFYRRIGSSIVGTRNLKRRLVLAFGQIFTSYYDVFYERKWIDDVEALGDSHGGQGPGFKEVRERRLPALWNYQPTKALRTSK